MYTINITINETLSERNTAGKQDGLEMFKVQKCQAPIFKSKNGVFELRPTVGNFHEKDFETSNYEEVQIDEKYIEVGLNDFGGRDKVNAFIDKDGEWKFNPVLKNPRPELVEFLKSLGTSSQKHFTLHKVYKYNEKWCLEQLFLSE